MGERGWVKIAKSFLFAHPVVKDFDVFRDFTFSLFAGEIFPMVHEFIFQRSPSDCWPYLLPFVPKEKLNSESVVNPLQPSTRILCVQVYDARICSIYDHDERCAKRLDFRAMQCDQ